MLHPDRRQAEREGKRDANSRSLRLVGSLGAAIVLVGLGLCDQIAAQW